MFHGLWEDGDWNTVWLQLPTERTPQKHWYPFNVGIELIKIGKDLMNPKDGTIIV